jgi:hypothetical protein
LLEEKMKLWFVSLVVCLTVGSLAGGLAAQTAGGYKGKQEDLPIKVAPQPIAFSHKKHSTAGLKCLDCHSGADRKERAGLPQAEQCMLCHATIATDSAEVGKLASFHERGEKAGWVRVYQLPDFVFFSHASHRKAGETCGTCHGPVETREVLAKEVSTSMIQCMNCHAAKKVSTECHLCHDLGQ